MGNLDSRFQIANVTDPEVRRRRMRLCVTVIEGRDLLRAPAERCTGTASRWSVPREPGSGRATTLDGASTSDAMSLEPAPAATVRSGKEKLVKKESDRGRGNASASFRMLRSRSPFMTPSRTKASSRTSEEETGEQRGRPFVWLRLRGNEQATTVAELEDDGQKNGEEGKELSKRSKMNEFDAVWNESFEFDVSGIWGEENDMMRDRDEVAHEEDQNAVLEIQVRDSVHCLNYGFVNIPLTRFSKSSVIKEWYQLQRSPKGPLKSTKSVGDSGACGVLYLSLHFETDEEEVDSVPSQSDGTSRTGSLSPRRRRLESRSSRSSRHDGDGSASPRKKALRPRRIPVRLADFVVLAKLRRGTKKPKLMKRFPEGDHDDLNLAEHVELFIFAFERKAETSLKNSELSVDGNPVDFFAFVLAPRSVPIYGYCLMYEDRDGIASLCIMSRFNCGDMFREVLFEMHSLLTTDEDSSEATLGKLSNRIVFQVPIPVPGQIGIEFTLSKLSDQKFSCSLPTPGSLPALTFANGLHFMMQNLGIQVMIELWGAMLLETRLLIHAKAQWKLSMASETVISLLYPFRWHHQYISVVPSQLREYVEAPFPIVMGIHTDLAAEVAETDLAQFLIVDLDRGVLRKGSKTVVESLPKSEARRLHRMLRHVLGLNPCRLDDPNDMLNSWGPAISSGQPMSQATAKRVQLCFLECFCHMFQGYRECLFFLNDSMPVFNTPKFLEMRAQDAVFFSHLLETQAFEKFKEAQESEELRTFHAYFFRVRIRERNRDQYLALGNQKRYAFERRRAAAIDPDDDDFDGYMRNQSVCEDDVHQVWKDRRSENVWRSRQRRRALGGHAPGLDPIDLEADNTWETHFFAICSCVHSEGNPEGSPPSYDLRSLAVDLGVDYDEVRDALKFLKEQIGTQNFNELGIDVMQFHDSSEISSEADSDEELFLSNRTSSAAWGYLNPASEVGYPNPARTLMKTDRRMETDLQECITKIFLNTAVEEELLQRCGEAFLTSPHARHLFVLILYQPQHRANSSSYIYAYANRGRGLREEAFKSLVDLCRALLKACEKREDYHNARQMLELSQSYYLDHIDGSEVGSRPTKSPMSSLTPRSTVLEGRRHVSAPISIEDYLEAYLRDLPLWHSLLFWEDAFAQTRNLEMRRQSRSMANVNVSEMATVDEERPLSGAMTNTENDEAPEQSNVVPKLHASLGGSLTIADSFRSVTAGVSRPKLRRMISPPRNEMIHSTKQLDAPKSPTSPGSPLSDDFSTETKACAANEEFQMQELLFELTTTMVSQMIRVGAPEDKAKALVSRVVTQHGLNESHEDTLCTLINNISRAVEANNRSP